MMKNIYKNMLISIISVIIMLGFASLTINAEEEVDDTIIYTLTYPDGSTYTAASYEEAQSKSQEWKLLYEGKTDADGIILLEEWAGNGEIKIIEKQIPKGYTAETTETIANLEDGEIAIINKKIEDAVVSEPKPVKVNNGNRYVVPKTGVEITNFSWWFIYSLFSFVIIKK